MPTVSIISPANNAPVSSDDVKNHLRIDGIDDDALITQIIGAAVEYLEREYDLAFITQTVRATFDRITGVEPIILPRSPASVINSVTYVDGDGVSQAISTFQSQLNVVPSEIAPALDEAWPEMRTDALAPLTIEYDAGFGNTSTDVPRRMKQAILLLIGHYYENREATISGTVNREIAVGLDRLIWSDRQYRFA